jgi:hypothetical protein
MAVLTLIGAVAGVVRDLLLLDVVDQLAEAVLIGRKIIFQNFFAFDFNLDTAAAVTAVTTATAASAVALVATIQ